MVGEPLDAAKAGLSALVRRDLGPADTFGLVAFDRRVQVVVPAQPLGDPGDVLAEIAAVGPVEGTDLGGGYLRALREVIRVAGDEAGVVGTVLVVSDGHVNVGITSPGGLGRIARQACADGIVTSTLGCGPSCDEALLTGLARDGGGTFAVA